MPVFDPGVPWLRGTATLTNGSTTVTTDGVIILNEILEGDRLYVKDDDTILGPFEIVGGEGAELELRESFTGSTGSYPVAIDRNPITRTGAKTLRDVARILATIEDADVEVIGEIRDETVAAKEAAEALYGDLTAVQQAKTEAEEAAGDARDDAILVSNLLGQTATHADNADASAQAAAQSKNAAAQSAHDADISAGASQNAEQNIAALTGDFTGSYDTYVFTAAGSETSLSGQDDTGKTLSYSPGTASVFKNGVKLIAGSDYSATDGSSITDLDPLAAGDVIEVQAFNLFSVIDSARRSQNLADLGDKEAAISNLGPFDSARVKKIGMPHVRRLDEILADRISIKDFGAYGGDPFQDTEAFKEAITYANEIWIPPGDYQITETMNVKRTLILRGSSGTESWRTQATVLHLPNDRPGFIFHQNNTNADEYGVPVIEDPTTGAYASVISNLNIYGHATIPYTEWDQSSHGIWTKCSVRIEDCSIRDFKGNGVHMDSTAASTDPYHVGNSNTWFMSNVYARGCTHGFMFTGKDANAGLGIKLNSVLNRGCGIYDDSFLGNTFVGCHSATNGRGARVTYNSNRYYCRSSEDSGSVEPGTDDGVWRLLGAGGESSIYHPWESGKFFPVGNSYRQTDLNAKSVFIGCYSESDNLPSFVEQRSLYVGGFFGGVEEGARGVGVYNDDANLSSQKPMSTSVSNCFVRIGSNTRKSVIEWRDEDRESSNTWGLVENNGNFRLDYGRLNANWVFYIIGQDNAITNGRSSPIPPYSFMVRELWIGSKSAARRLIDMTRPQDLDDGKEYARGDILFNASPTAGGNVGWICTTGGISGSTAVFKEFGAIDA